MITLILTGITLTAFAANSLLCRMALGGNLIDPVSFTSIRLVSGAIALALMSRLIRESTAPDEARGSWGSGFALFAYAVTFSLAYVSLNTGMGALILFGSVQVTMLVAALKSGERLGAAQWFGLAWAFGGLIYLVLPGISAPDPLGAVLMITAGVSWGVYSIRGKGSAAPVLMTAGNFARSAPMAIMASAIAFSAIYLEPVGIALALISGIVTSGLGYVLWYTALRSLSTTQASVAQLLAPPLAAFGGVAFLSEQVSFRLIAASTIILGGVAFLSEQVSFRLIAASTIILGGVALAVIKRKPDVGFFKEARGPANQFEPGTETLASGPCSGGRYAASLVCPVN